MFLAVKTKKTTKWITVNEVASAHYTSESGVDKKPKLTIRLTSGDAIEFTNTKVVESVTAWLAEQTTIMVESAAE